MGQSTYTLKYRYAGEVTPGFEEDIEKLVPKLVDEVLRVQNKSQIDDVTAAIHARMEEIKNAGDKDQWADKIAALKKQLERDAYKNVDVGSGIQEDNLARRREELFSQLSGERSDLVNALWDRVDNNERGGIDYTIQIIQRVKDRIENAETGLVPQIRVTGKWFEDLSGRIKAEEVKILEEHLGQTKGKGLFGFGKETQADAKLIQLSEALSLWITSHLRAVACREAETLLLELSGWLGKKTGTDSSGEPIWKGFIGKLEEGRTLVRGVMREMQQEIARTDQAIKSAHATYEVIPTSVAIADRKVPPEQAKAWAMETFANYGGKRELFKRLASPESRSELISELRNVALRKLPEDTTKTRENPLFEALRKHPARSNLFEKCLKRAMPWVDANLSGQFVSKQDFFSCVIGVADAAAFDREFGEEFRKAVPTQAGITARKIEFEESGIPGRLTCYIEFSGLPLTALRQLRNWRLSYDREGKKIPVHCHKDKTLFVHPIAPTSQELDQLAGDFSLFLKAVGLGVLARRIGGNEYEVKKRGNRFSIGSERTVRLEGMANEHRAEIESQLAAQLDKARSPYQLAGLALLYEYYAQEAFKPRKVKSETAVETLSEGLGYVLCTQMHEHSLKEFQAKAKAQRLDVQEILDRLSKGLDAWTDTIRGSEKDGYLHEVHDECQAKRVVMPEFFEAGWLEGLFTPKATSAPASASSPVMPPPLDGQASLQCWIAVDGQRVGPLDTPALLAHIANGKLTPVTLIWYQGLASWLPASQAPVVAPLFASSPPPLPVQ
jgi:hypothetical protein